MKHGDGDACGMSMRTDRTIQSHDRFVEITFIQRIHRHDFTKDMLHGLFDENANTNDSIINLS